MTKKTEALDQLLKFHKAFEQGSMTDMLKAVGITDEIAELMNIEDLGDALAVRIADLMKVANGERSTQ